MWICAVDESGASCEGGHRYRRVAAHVDERGALGVSWPGGQSFAPPPAGLPNRPGHHGAGAQTQQGSGPHHQDITAPMAARVLAVLVQPGAQVAAGAQLLVLEAMKMEHTLVAPSTRTVRAVPVALGDQVTHGQLLVQFAPEDDS